MVLADNGVVSRWWLAGRQYARGRAGACVSHKGTPLCASNVACLKAA